MKQVSSSTYWKPRKDGCLMAVPFLADGVTLSGIAIMHDTRKFKSLAIVIETTNCRVASPGDVILFKEGQYEALSTTEEEDFYFLEESAIVMVMENLFYQQDAPIIDSSKLPINPLVTTSY